MSHRNSGVICIPRITGMRTRVAHHASALTTVHTIIQIHPYSAETTSRRIATMRSSLDSAISRQHANNYKHFVIFYDSMFWVVTARSGSAAANGSGSGRGRQLTAHLCGDDRNAH